MHTYIYIYIYNVYIYIYIYIISASWKPPGRFVIVSVVDIIQLVVMVSVVGFCLWFPLRQETFVYGFRRWFFIASVVAGNLFDMVSAHADTQWQRHPIFSPAARDPDLMSGLRGFNRGRARFQGNCCCLFVVCCLVVFWAGEHSREAEPRSTATCRVSATLPLRFRYVSVMFPWCASFLLLRGTCQGASVKEASAREQW